jgi:energy-coupling factor transporter transmembrane protein EcfT
VSCLQGSAIALCVVVVIIFVLACCCFSLLLFCLLLLLLSLLFCLFMLYLTIQSRGTPTRVSQHCIFVTHTTRATLHLVGGRVVVCTTATTAPLLHSRERRRLVDKKSAHTQNMVWLLLWENGQHHSSVHIACVQ